MSRISAQNQKHRLRSLVTVQTTTDNSITTLITNHSPAIIINRRRS